MQPRPRMEDSAKGAVLPSKDLERAGEQHDDAHAPAPAWLVRYVAFLARYKLAVLLFWTAVMGIGFFGMSRVFPALVLRIAAVPGAADAVAQGALAAAFPQVASAQSTTVLRVGDPQLWRPHLRAWALMPKQPSRAAGASASASGSCRSCARCW